MKPRDPFELLLLGAIWGASFLFMHLGAAERGRHGAVHRPAEAARPRGPGSALNEKTAAGLPGRPFSDANDAYLNFGCGTVRSSPGSEPMYSAMAFSSAVLNCFTWPAMMALPRPTCGLPVVA